MQTQSCHFVAVYGHIVIELWHIICHNDASDLKGGEEAFTKTAKVRWVGTHIPFFGALSRRWLNPNKLV